APSTSSARRRTRSTGAARSTTESGGTDGAYRRPAQTDRSLSNPRIGSDQHGNTVRLSDFRGRKMIVCEGYQRAS
ncbi:MAG: hypothetical protein QOJ23_3177, partial [Actinomycetota bacterium]|nr:hypothetical protein [Actinomycetota bacterium]